jgi:hypothetical protein
VNVNDLKAPSKYLQKEDCGERGILVTIKGVSQERIGRGPDAEMKYILHFQEPGVKPMVLNKTNGQRIAKITGVTESCEVGWVGHKIVCYNDPDVEFAGEVIGGVRVRAPRLPPPVEPRQAVRQPQPMIAPGERYDDVPDRYPENQDADPLSY